MGIFLSLFLTSYACACSTADGAVTAKIAEELAYEKEAASEGEPDFLKDFKNTGIWTVCHTLPSFFSWRESGLLKW
jgi:hypothetical protein